MGEVQLRRIVSGGPSVALVHLVNRDAEPRMVVRRASVVEIASVRGHSNACQRKKGEKLKHLEVETQLPILCSLKGSVCGTSIFLYRDCGPSLADVTDGSPDLLHVVPTLSMCFVDQ